MTIAIQSPSFIIKAQDPSQGMLSKLPLDVLKYLTTFLNDREKRVFATVNSLMRVCTLETAGLLNSELIFKSAKAIYQKLKRNFSAIEQTIKTLIQFKPTSFMEIDQLRISAKKQLTDALLSSLTSENKPLEKLTILEKLDVLEKINIAESTFQLSDEIHRHAISQLHELALNCLGYAGFKELDSSIKNNQMDSDILAARFHEDITLPVRAYAILNDQKMVQKIALQFYDAQTPRQVVASTYLASSSPQTVLEAISQLKTDKSQSDAYLMMAREYAFLGKFDLVVEMAVSGAKTLKLTGYSKTDRYYKSYLSIHLFKLIKILVANARSSLAMELIPLILDESIQEQASTYMKENSNF